MTHLYIAVLEQRLHEAKKLEADWTARRKGQVGNCISDQEHQLDAQRLVKNLEFQIKEAQNGHHHN